MSYLVLARKWRPQSFADLVGQEHVSQTLSNAIEGKEIAFRLRLPASTFRAVPVPPGAVSLAQLDRALEAMEQRP
jgi:hypothetical protein